MNDFVIPPSGRVLGIDWGTSRIGVAISDETQLVASPLATLRRRAGKRLPMRDFLTIVEREHPVGLVVGLALDDDSAEGTAATAAREMGDVFGAKSGLPLDWTDESFSTVEAQGVMLASGRSRHHRAEHVDSAAAATLLQQWLDRRRREPRV